MTKYNPMELLICLASRLMEDGTSAFIGTGVPMLAAVLAKKTHAPNLMPVFEFGGLGSPLEELPLGVGGSRSFYKALAASSITDVMEAAARGHIEFGFLGGAQIDMYGNLNSTILGDYKNPKVRFPGSGGANDIGSLCWRTITLVPHQKRKYTNDIDFLTTPGYLSGPGAREAAGLPPGSGPYRVVSNLGIMGFDEDSKRMKLLAVNPGVTVQDVIDNTGFEMLIADDVYTTEAPTSEELHILRTEVDPKGYYLK
ncbi:MAG: 3-oxoacid CoA-transferase [Candidatus Heimdallarchaeota archaeon]|nr:3-oxoacid CoA-transferase [Candidatus Heimdallarchaeota archaeon]